MFRFIISLSKKILASQMSFLQKLNFGIFLMYAALGIIEEKRQICLMDHHVLFFLIALEYSSNQWLYLNHLMTTQQLELYLKTRFLMIQNLYLFY